MYSTGFFLRRSAFQQLQDLIKATEEKVDETKTSIQAIQITVTEAANNQGVTAEDLAPILAPYALKTELPVVPSLAPYALKTEIPDISGKADRSEIPAPMDLTPYALKNEVAQMVLDIGDQAYAFKSEIPDISGKADRSELPAPVDLTPYALKTEVPDVSGKADIDTTYTKTEVNNALQLYASKTDLQDIRVWYPIRPSYVRTAWLKASSFLGQLATGSVLSGNWQPPTGYETLSPAVFAGSPAFFYDPVSQPVPYVATYGNASYFHLNGINPNTLTQATGFTLVIVWRKPNQTGEVWFPRINTRNVPGGPNVGQIRIMILNTQLTGYVTWSGTAQLPNLTFTANAWNVTVFKISLDDVTLSNWNNGTRVLSRGSISASAANVNGNFADCVVDNWFHFGTSGAELHIAEVQVFNYGLSHEEIGAIQGELRTTYGLL